MALSVVLPILGLLILLGIWLICKQKKSKGNFVVKELWALGWGWGVGAWETETALGKDPQEYMWT